MAATALEVEHDIDATRERLAANVREFEQRLQPLPHASGWLYTHRRAVLITIGATVVAVRIAQLARTHGEPPRRRRRSITRFIAARALHREVDRLLAGR